MLTTALTCFWLLTSTMMTIMQGIHFLLKVSFLDPKMSTNLLLCSLSFVLLQKIPMKNSDDANPNQARSHGISIAKGISILFVGIIHSDNPDILNNYWLHRRVINKAVPIMMVCYGITAFRRNESPKSVWKSIKWSFARLSKLTIPLYTFLAALWVFRFATNWIAKYKFISNNEPILPLVLRSMLVSSNCVGGFWFVSMFALIVILSPFLNRLVSSMSFLVILCMYGSAVSLVRVEDVMTIKQYLPYFSEPCDGNSLLYAIVYWPRWVAHPAIGFVLSKQWHYLVYDAAQYKMLFVCMFIICELVQDLQLLHMNLVLDQIANIISEAFLTLIFISMSNIEEYSCHAAKCLMFMGDNSFYLYIGHVLTLNVCVVDFTMSSLKIIPATGRSFTYPVISCAVGIALVQCKHLILRRKNDEGTIAAHTEDKYTKRFHSQRLHLVFRVVSGLIALGLIVRVDTSRHESRFSIPPVSQSNHAEYARTAPQIKPDMRILHASPPPMPRLKHLQPLKENMIFTLIKGGKSRVNDYNDYIQRCEELKKLNLHTFEDIAFHEGNIPDTVMYEIKKEHNVRFENVHKYGAFRLPNVSWMKKIRGPSEYPLGYKHMCRFFSIQWMHIAQLYKYAMRIDEDVLVHSMPINPAEFMNANPEIVYGYALKTTEKHTETLQTYQTWISSYWTNTEVDVKPMYFTNFFLTKVDFWLRKDVQKFLQDVDNTGNIYTHRWGDAPLQTSALTMFAKDEVKFFRVDYSHASTGNEIRNGRETVYIHSTDHSAEKTEFEEFMSYFETCAAVCLVANTLNIGPKFTSSSQAFEAVKGAFLLESGLSSEMIKDYSAHQLALSYQLDIRKTDGPLPNDHLSVLERIDKITASLDLPKNSTDAERLAAVKRYPCCRYLVLQKPRAPVSWKRQLKADQTNAISNAVVSSLKRNAKWKGS